MWLIWKWRCNRTYMARNRCPTLCTHTVVPTDLTSRCGTNYPSVSNTRMFIVCMSPILSRERRVQLERTLEVTTSSCFTPPTTSFPYLDLTNPCNFVSLLFRCVRQIRSCCGGTCAVNTKRSLACTSSSAYLDRFKRINSLFYKAF